MTKHSLAQQRADAFYQAVAPFFTTYFSSPPHLIEFCAGNGNAGKVFQERGLAQQVTFVDVRKVRGLERTLGEIHGAEVDLSGIDEYILPSGTSSAVIAIHACGILTDKVLEKAVHARVPVAVMPCCYNDQIKRYQLQQPPDSRLLHYPRPEDHDDTVRLQFLREQGYRAELHQINPRITPMNNVIIGVPS